MADGLSPPARVKPLLRGVSHEAAVYVAAPAALALWAYAPAGARLGVGTYGASLVVLFLMSAFYHRPTWNPRQRDWLGRLDQAAIFLLIAGTATPIGLALGSEQLLWVVWVGAAAGVLLALLWPSAPKPLMAAVYVLLGWSSVPQLPAMVRTLGPLVMALVVAGGLLYTVGAVVYARKRPDPYPAVFGYHEIFHLCVVVAALLHFGAIVGAVAATAGAATGVATLAPGG